MYATHPEAEALLRETVALARRAPFYAEHLQESEVRALTDLDRLPVTTKEHLRQATPFGMLAVPREELWHYHESTGTTGQPIACWYRKEEFAIMGESVVRWFPEWTPGKILLDRFPSFAPISFCIEAALQLQGGCHIPCGNLSWDVPFPRALDFLRTLRPQIIACLPLEMFLLWELALALGIDPARELDSLEMALLAGAPLPGAMRRIVERDWGVAVREIYGSNETLFLGASCERGTLHLETRLFIAEVLDPETLKPVEAGEVGVFTLTHLGPKAMPLVRYLTRDMIRVVPCACGRPEPAIELLGRQDEIADLGGKRLYTADILDCGYDLADAHGSRVFFAVIRAADVVFCVETDGARPAIDARAVRTASDNLGVPVVAEAARRGDLLDPTALVRTPKVYKPTQIADWRRPGRKPASVMEALLEWPKMDAATALKVLGRVLRTRLRRRRLMKA
ncbi:MAG TPA: AMP-binding protein [Candidatus Binatia bacterium]|nr:AMP-binding protein [Candidatus Binatia bacterium]